MAALPSHVEPTADSDSGLAERPANTSCAHSVKVFFVGQAIAFLVGCTGLFSQLLATNGVDIPTVQNALNYLCLSFALLVHAGKSGWRLRLSSPWWAYAIVAFFDLEANYAVTKAYQCTDITSIMLLDCMTIPTCFILSRIFLKAQFRCIHYVGIALCLTGIAIIIVSDTVFAKPEYFGDMSLVSDGPSTSVSFDVTTASSGIIMTTNGTTPMPTPAFCLDSRLVGDALCLAGSIMYGVSNVAQEKIVKEKPIAEFLGMLGLFGFAFSCVQVALLERQELESLDWLQTDNLLYLLGFAVSLTCMYILTSAFLRMADSTFFNISLLFSDFWAVVVSWALFHTLPQWLYFVAVPFVIAGCIVYSLKRVIFGSSGGGTPYQTLRPANGSGDVASAAETGPPPPSRKSRSASRRSPLTSRPVEVGNVVAETTLFGSSRGSTAGQEAASAYTYRDDSTSSSGGSNDNRDVFRQI